MPSLFQGEPQTATSYVNTTSELPKWQQDALYNQIQLATNTANRPYTPYPGETVAGFAPEQLRAYNTVSNNVGAYQPGMDFANFGMQAMAGKNTAEQLQAGQAPYLRQDLVGSNLNQGQQLFGQAGTATAQSLAERALTTATPYLATAGQTSASQVGQYMSPYQQGVLDVIAKQGARNLSENLLPQVSDSFIKAGQFGSNRMGEFGSRALRDTQEAVLNQQSQAAQQGYGQALSAAQGDLARQAQLAGTAGSISGADLSRVLQGGAQYANLGQMQTASGQAQQQYGLSAAQQNQAAQAQDYTRQMSALQSVGDIARQNQALRTADAAALESAGAAQQNLAQKNLDANLARFTAEQNYPKSQLDWLSTQVRGIAPLVQGVQTQTGTTTGASYSPSPLSQLATGLYTAKGLASI
jgi:hypothetical protein